MPAIKAVIASAMQTSVETRWRTPPERKRPGITQGYPVACVIITV